MNGFALAMTRAGGSLDALMFWLSLRYAISLHDARSTVFHVTSW